MGTSAMPRENDCNRHPRPSRKLVHRHAPPQLVEEVQQDECMDAPCGLAILLRRWKHQKPFRVWRHVAFPGITAQSDSHWERLNRPRALLVHGKRILCRV